MNCGICISNLTHEVPNLLMLVLNLLEETYTVVLLQQGKFICYPISQQALQ